MRFHDVAVFFFRNRLPLAHKLAIRDEVKNAETMTLIADVVIYCL